MAHETSAASAPVGALAAALLRTGAWLYGGLWVVAAATSPWGPPGPLAVALVAPLAPLVLLATLRGQVRRPPAPAADGPGAADLAARADAFLSAPPGPRPPAPPQPARVTPSQ